MQEIEDRGTDPLTFWKLREADFPSLAVMAKTVLAVPATSTPSERAFSSGRLILHYTRSRMSAQTFRALICLNNWYKKGLYY